MPVAKVQASETFGSSTRKEKSKDIPQGTFRLPCSADNITTKTGSHIIPVIDGIDYEEILHQALLLVNTRVKPRYSHWRDTGACQDER
ncbi:unnamed protein product [Strongylus vulgaris]|uniref:Uncharacterized protein n=1 Tax=Strongylus vulgaris TaxID=40348 RepID=A0A3P7IXE5_STRVU|nr:unnamed protein product [Strongylus vulgaris]